MPGPVSDSFDPEFGTGENCRWVADEIDNVIRKQISPHLGEELKYILEVLRSPAGKVYRLNLSERDLRIIRFAMLRALEGL